MAQSEDPPAWEGEEGDGSNTVQDSVFSHEELAELVQQSYKRLLELDNELDEIKNRGTKFFKIFDAKV